MEDNYTVEEQLIINQAKADGTYLKAPNGEDTNLDPKQWAQVRTAAFKEWFGDWQNSPNDASKILDANGEPQVMYHGSRSTFNTFDITLAGGSSKMGKIGFWFTPIESFAQNFAEDIWWGNDEQVTTYNTFLSLKNPKIYEKRDVEKEIEVLENQVSSIRSELKQLMAKWETSLDWAAYEAFGIAIRDGFPNIKAKEYYADRTPNSREAINDGERARELEEQKKHYSDHLGELIYNDPYEQLRADLYKLAGMNAFDANIGGTGMAMDDEDEVIAQFKKDLKLQGFDGIIIRGTSYDRTYANGINDQYVVFQPNQIKSAINNIGKYSLENDDIRYRFIGEKGAANRDRAEEATFRLDNLAIARDMELVGKDSLTIKLATGWERGADKKWRYEENDFRIKENIYFSKNNDGSYSLMLSDFNSDDQLFDEYPELTGISIIIKNDVSEKASLVDSAIKITGNFVSEGKLLPDKISALESILGHEIQHAIQEKEGFCRGGSPDEFSDMRTQIVRDLNFFTDGHFMKGSVISDTQSIREALKKSIPYANVTLAEGYKDELRKVALKYGYSDLTHLVDNFDKLPTAVEQYHKLAGEVEARNVQSRMDMTSEERRLSLAQLTEDVDRKDQIFLKYSFSEGMPSSKAEFIPAIETLANSIHVPINIIHDISEVTNGVAKKRIEAGNNIKGWFIPATNNISIYLPHISDLEDAHRTLFHEAVAHYGLRKMFGEHFNVFLDNVYNNATSEIQGKIMYATHGDPSQRLVATEEYLAKLAERGFHNPEEISLWEKAKFAFIDMLHQAGVKLGFKLHDNDLRGILYKSYLNQVMEASSNNTKFLNTKTVNNETTLKPETSALPSEIKDAPSTKIKLVVYKEHTLGYILPELPNSVQILHSSPLKGANGTTNLQDNYHINNLNEIRLASEKDFDDFNVDFKGYDDKEVYEYSEGVNTHKALKTNFLDDEFKAAVEGEDYKKLCQLKERGYVPTEEFIKSFSNNASINSLVTIQKIFGLSAMEDSLAEIETIQGWLCGRRGSSLSVSTSNNISID